MKSLRKLFAAGLALLGLVLASSLQAASLPTAATRLSDSEMQEISGGTVFVTVTHLLQWSPGGTFYLTVQTPVGPMQTPVWIILNAYYKASTSSSAWYNNDGNFSPSVSQRYSYQGGPIAGVISSSLRTDVSYFHVVNGWPVGGL